MTATTDTKIPFEDLMYEFARPSDCPLAISSYNTWTTTLDTSFGKVFRTAQINAGSMIVKYEHEYENDKGKPTTFGHGAELYVWDRRLRRASDEFVVEVTQASIGGQDPLTASIRALLFQLASIEATHISARLEATS
jgi:hypothetical protein